MVKDNIDKRSLVKFADEDYYDFSLEEMKPLIRMAVNWHDNDSGSILTDDLDFLKRISAELLKNYTGEFTS